MTSGVDVAARALAEFGEKVASLVPRQVFVVSQISGAPADLFRLQVTENLRQAFMQADASNGADWCGYTPMQYLPGRLIPSKHLMWAKADSVTLIQSLHLDDDASAVVPALDLGDMSATNLKMTITTSASPCGFAATFFRITRNTARLARAKRIAAVFRNGAFSSLDEEVLLFNNYFDAIAVSDHVFFANRHTFERAFGFLEELHAQAAVTFETATRGLAISNVDELRSAATTDINMMAKMASIQRKLDANPQYAAALTMPNLLRFIDANPQIVVPIVGEGASRRLEFQSSPSARYKILKLLDDDFLKSGLTNFDYAVDSKSEPLA